MQELVLVYGALSAIILAMIAFRALRSDQPNSRKLAKIRVPVDDRGRKRVDDTPEDEYDSKVPLIWLAFGMSVIFLVILAQAL